AGLCLARFHRAVAGLPHGLLAEVVPGFHDLPRYLEEFDDEHSRYSEGLDSREQHCLDAIGRMRGRAFFFVQATEEKQLCKRVVHGDPKISNILFDRRGIALTMIDLDTVGPGLLLQDIGDCLRSCCNPLGEDTKDEPLCEAELFGQFIRGYMEEDQNLWRAMVQFKLADKLLTRSTQCRARRGRLQTKHGVVQTPIFMPVGTQATVKAITPQNLKEIGAQIILGNTYHLYIRPGNTLIKDFGGLHGFMGWDKPILTDSGGFQIFSLKDLATITEEGAAFRSHLDGAKLFLSPEDAIAVQQDLGSDVMMCLDTCIPYPCTKEATLEATQLTSRWARRCRAAHENRDQLLFAIVQGGVFPDLRELSAQSLVEIGFDGYAIGGLSVGEEKQQMYDMTEATVPHFPTDHAVYLMGVGTPEDLVEGSGDKVVTRGGIIGTIAGLTDSVITLEIAKDVRVKVSRDAIAGSARTDKPVEAKKAS
ncbi:unnamed protein product, partial [Cyprideis torosa]